MDLLLVFMGLCLIVEGILIGMNSVTMIYQHEITAEMIRRGWFTVDDLSKKSPRWACWYLTLVFIVSNKLDARSLRNADVEVSLRPWNMGKFEYRINTGRPSRSKEKIESLKEAFRPPLVPQPAHLSVRAARRQEYRPWLPDPFTGVSKAWYPP